MSHADSVIRESSVCPALMSRMGSGGNQVPLVLYNTALALGVAKEEAVCKTLCAQFDNQTDTPLVLQEHSAPRSVVRRLTPVECERLMGFDDNWTRIPYRGRPADQCPDSPRYRAIGNSWAVPCVRWIGERIKKEIEGGNND